MELFRDIAVKNDKNISAYGIIFRRDPYAPEYLRRSSTVNWCAVAMCNAWTTYQDCVRIVSALSKEPE